jgi:Ca2+-binding EF-hand superfamily protein
LAEFIETMHQFSGQGEDEKISFLFKVYDLNGKFTIIFTIVTGIERCLIR